MIKYYTQQSKQKDSTALTSLYVCFQIGAIHYAIPSQDVMRVIPLIHFKDIPEMPKYLSGVGLVHGKRLPLIDLCLFLNNQPFQPCLSTRILIIQHETLTNPIGFIAESVTDLFYASSLEYNQENNYNQTPYLKGMLDNDQCMIHVIDITQLLLKFEFLHSLQTYLHKGREINK